MKTIGELETELLTRQAELRRLRNDLAGAEHVFMTSRGDGSSVSALREQVHLAELRVAGVERDLERARAPRKVVPSFSSRPEDVVRAINALERARAYRHAQHDESVRRTLSELHPRTPDEHKKAHVRNIFGPTERQRRELDAADAARLADLRAQLAMLTDMPGPSAA